MNKTIKFLAIFNSILLGGIFINATANKDTTKVEKKETSTQSSKATAENYAIKAIKTPSYLDLAGEAVPLSTPDIKERLDRELLVNTYWQSNGLLLLKRANKYFPIIEPILEKHGVPNDFKYLAVIESGLQNVSSRAGASGFWQIMPTTGREYGLEVNKNVDERYDLEKATVVACKYLKKYKEKFGSWTLAAAAYNAGAGRISKELAKQKVSNYYDLALVSETSRYIPRVIAVKEILSNPIKYGFEYDQEDLYTLRYFEKILVDYPIKNLADFAIKNGISYKELKLYNPWLHENHLNNKSKKKYYISIPK